MKKKRSKGCLYRIVILLLLGIMLFCGYKIAKILYEYHEGSKVYSDVARDAKVKVGKKQVSVDWKKLRKKRRCCCVALFRGQCDKLSGGSGAGQQVLSAQAD